MGTIELHARRKRRTGYVQRALLAAIEVSGLLLLAAAAPNTAQLLGKLKRYDPKSDFQIKNTALRLVKRGHARFENRGGKKYLALTPSGKQVLDMERQSSALARRRKRRWDGRWRFVIFDIPERNRTTRNRLRLTLKSFGFEQLQASVWVYPYDCEEFTTLLKAELRLGSRVLYAVVEHIENDALLRRRFKLR